jgi:hypothetical protein
MAAALDSLAVFEDHLFFASLRDSARLRILECNEELEVSENKRCVQVTGERGPLA